jgi:hypothetical protein
MPTRAEMLEWIARESARPSSGEQGQEWLGRPPTRLLTLPGTDVKLKRNGTKTISVEANDPLVNEWGIYISVEPESFKVLANPIPVIWGVRLTVLPSFDSANFVYYRPCNRYENTLVPVCGVALAVHGQRVNIQLKRDDVDDATGEMVLMAAIMPRLPGVGTEVSNGFTSNAIPFNDVIPAMGRTLRFAAAVSVGDLLLFKDPGEVVIATIPVSSDMVLRPIPIPKLGYKVEYFTVDLGAKDIMIEYETFM